MAKPRSKAPWIVGLLLLIGAVVYFQLQPKTEHQPATPNSLDLKKTSTGGVVDYTASAQKIHAVVDQALTKVGVSIGEVKENKREQPRQNVAGMILWHSRQMVVTMPAEMTLEKVKQAVIDKLRGTGGEVISAQPDTYQGGAVVRLEIAIRDTLEGDPVTIITDRIYVAVPKDKASQPVDKPKPNASGRGELAIVIDDFGYTKEPIGAFTAIDRPLTFAVLPYLAYSSEAATRGNSTGHQVIVHLPLEPLASAEQSEAITIMVSMSDEEIRSITAKAISAIPGVIGVNNHQGSRGTADKRVMRQVLDVVKARNLFFVDSRTNGQSVVGEVARQLSVHTTDNELFLDNSNEVSAVKKQLRTAGDLALKHGSATVIGHARMSTATALREMIPELEAEGIKLVFVSQLVR